MQGESKGCATLRAGSSRGNTCRAGYQMPGQGMAGDGLSRSLPLGAPSAILGGLGWPLVAAGPPLSSCIPSSLQLLRASASTSLLHHLQQVYSTGYPCMKGDLESLCSFFLSWWNLCSLGFVMFFSTYKKKKKKSLVVFGWFLFFYTKKKYLTSKRNLCLQSVTEKVAIQLQIHS